MRDQNCTFCTISYFLYNSILGYSCLFLVSAVVAPDLAVHVHSNYVQSNIYSVIMESSTVFDAF